METSSLRAATQASAVAKETRQKTPERAPAPEKPAPVQAKEPSAQRSEESESSDYSQGQTPVLHAGEPGSVVDIEAQYRELRESVAQRLRDEV